LDPQPPKNPQRKVIAPYAVRRELLHANTITIVSGFKAKVM
jgi:hypothetical protein